MADDEKSVVATQKESGLATIAGLKNFINKESKGLFIAQISDKENAETLFLQELSFAIQLLNNMNSKAQDFFLSVAARNPESLKFAVANVAATGLSLNPAMRLAYLIPRKNGIIFQSSWMGKKELLIRSGYVFDAWAEIVYSNDEFTMLDIATRKFTHVANPFATASERGQMVGGYGVAKLSNGEIVYEFVSLEMINTLLSKSDALNSDFSPYKTGFYEDMIKTKIFNRLARVLPKTAISDDYIKMLGIDVENVQYENITVLENKKNLAE